MKKIILVSALAVAPSLASADTILGIYAGAGTWNTDLSGEIGVDDDPMTADELGFSSDSNNYFYAALEHPIPLLPNFRVASTSLELNGASTVTRSFTLDDVTFDADVDTTTELDFSHTDITLYYELLDNWATWDLGITARSLDGFVQVSGESSNAPTTERVDLEGTIPMVYSRVQLDLPLTGFHVGGALNLVSYDGDSYSDYEIYVGYATSGLGLDIGLDLGVREMSVDVTDDEDLTADLSVDGVFGAVTLHF